jgi:hypothetical protein
MELISIGEFCLPGWFIKNILHMKNSSYPYDWVYSNLDTVIYNLEHYFQHLKQLIMTTDTNYIIDQNVHYLSTHHNISLDEDKQYFIRCIERFKKIIHSSDKKIIFVHSTYNDTQTDNSLLTDCAIDKLIKLSETIQNVNNELDFSIVSLQFKTSDNEQMYETKELDQNVKIITFYTSDEQTLDKWIIHMQDNGPFLKDSFLKIINKN